MDFSMKRLQMLGGLRLSGITDERVLMAMGTVPRECFLPAGKLNQAYASVPVGIGYQATVPPTMLTAQILQALHLQGTERVLELGTGCGYQAAVLARLAAEVHTVEPQRELAASARARLATLGIGQVQVHEAGDEMGWPAAAPYDAIVVAASVPHLPVALLHQLQPDGRLVVPVGNRSQQSLLLVRLDDGHWQADQLATCSVMPLAGPGGWPDRPMQEASRPWF